jgi:hypothetical protein
MTTSRGLSVLLLVAMVACAGSGRDANVVQAGGRLVRRGTEDSSEWASYLFVDEDGTVCSSMVEGSNRWAHCEQAVRGQVGGGTRYLSWAYSPLESRDGTVFNGLAAKEVAKIRIVLRNGDILTAVPVDRGLNVDGWAVSTRGSREASRFEAWSADGRLLERL